MEIVNTGDASSDGHTGHITAVLPYPTQAYYRVSGHNGQIAEECLARIDNGSVDGNASMKSQMAANSTKRCVRLIPEHEITEHSE